MANKQSVITITHVGEAQQTVNDLLRKASSKARTESVAVSRYFDALAGGNRKASYTVSVNSGDAVAATGTITMSAFTAGDTITIGTQVFTGSGAPSGANQFLSTGGDTAVAAAAVVKINAHTSLTGVVSATASSGVITVTCAIAGLVGNQIGIAISAHGSVSGSGKLTSGANATTTNGPTTYHNGA